MILQLLRSDFFVVAFCYFTCMLEPDLRLTQEVFPDTSAEGGKIPVLIYYIYTSH